MGSYEETMLQLTDMKSRYDSGFSYSDKQLLESLNRLIFGKGITNTGCNDCYRDAYIIIMNHLKKTKTMPAKPNYVLKAGALIHPAGTSKFYTNALPSDDIAEEHLSKFPADIIKFAHYPADYEQRVEAYKARKLVEQSDSDKTSGGSGNDSAHLSMQIHASYDKELSAKDEVIAGLKARLADAEEALALAKQKQSEVEDKLSKVETEKTDLLQMVDELKSANIAPVEESFGEESEETASLRMELETVKTELESAIETIDKLKSDNRALKAANTRLKNNASKDSE